MKFYRVQPPYRTDDEEGEDTSIWKSSKAEALKVARQLAKDYEEERQEAIANPLTPRGDILDEMDIEVDRIIINEPPSADLILRILNQRGYVSKRERVATIKVGRVVK